MSARPHSCTRGATASAALLVAALLVAAVLSAGCPISGELLPAMGRMCRVADALCDVEHVCRPEALPDGLCAPVMSYGRCDEAEGQPSHPPGRMGEIKDASEVKIADAADLEQLAEVRLVTGRVQIFEEGAGDATVGSLCPLRDLQVVQDGFAIGDSDLVDLDGLQSLTTVQRGLAIFNNRELQSLAGLENLVEVTGRQLDTFTDLQLIIAGNPQLPEDEIERLEQRLRDLHGGTLRSISCSNRADACEGAELALLNLLAGNGVPR